MKQGKKYSVKWVDTFSYQGWWNEGEIKVKAKELSAYLETIGIYIGKYYGFVVLAMTKNNNPEFDPWGSIKWIPEGCIKKIKEIK